jgi:predicted ATP-dependent endonuclease of OLD family
MSTIIKSLKIENFRGIQSLEMNFRDLNMIIGNNGTNKTNILEALNFALSPVYLANRIKPTDFYRGINKPINIELVFSNNFKAKLPDGYTSREIECNKIKLMIKKRERRSPGKVLSDLVTIEHIIWPSFPPKQEIPGNEKWAVKRKKESEFSFGRRSLSFDVFESNEIPRSFYFNKERDRQLYKGFNTSFSSVIEDLNWRYLKEFSNSKDISELLGKITEVETEILKKTKIEKHDVIKKLNEEIEEFGLDKINFSFIDKSTPFDQLFLSKEFEYINLPVKYLGSGIQMIYSLLFLDALASFSKERLIILIDEPELHLHPILQEKFADYLYKLSKNNNYQVFFTTHSPIFFKTLISKKNVVSLVSRKDNDEFSISRYLYSHSIFPWGPTWGEINYFAYDYPTIEFHNELYGYLQEITNKYIIKEFDNYLSNEHKISKDRNWTREKNGQPKETEKVTLMTFIRNKIHHPENETMSSQNFENKDLKESIKKMLEIIKSENNK